MWMGLLLWGGLLRYHQCSIAAVKVSFTYILCLSLQIGEKLRLEEQRNSSAIISCSVAKIENFTWNFRSTKLPFYCWVGKTDQLAFSRRSSNPCSKHDRKARSNCTSIKILRTNVFSWLTAAEQTDTSRAIRRPHIVFGPRFGHWPIFRQRLLRCIFAHYFHRHSQNEVSPVPPSITMSKSWDTPLAYLRSLTNRHKCVLRWWKKEPPRDWSRWEGRHGGISQTW